MYYKQTYKTKKPLNIYAFMALAAIFMAKLTKFDQWSVYGFDFFPKIPELSGFEGSTHYLSTFLVYFIVFSTIVFLIKLGIKDIVKSYKRKKEIKMIKDFESGKSNLKWYQKIPLISKFFSWYKKGVKIWFSNKVDKSYNFGSFIFFNFMLVNIDFFIIAQSSIS